MKHWKSGRNAICLFLAFAASIMLSACANEPDLPSAPRVTAIPPFYIVAPGDNVEIFVWRNPDLSNTVTVRPDGRFTVPLIEDLPAAGRTPTDLARDIEKELSTYIQTPVVSVIMRGFAGTYEQSIRIVGEASEPASLLYRKNMTVMDAMISVGGLTRFAAGNRAVIVRNENGEEKQYSVRLDDLLKEGDISANASLLPGDILIIPQSWF